MIRRPPRSTQSRSSAASDVYKRQPMRGRDCQTNRPVPRQFTQFHQLRNANQERELDDRRGSEREITVLREDETAVFCAQELSVHGAWTVSYTHLTLPTI